MQHPCTSQCMQAFNEPCSCECMGENHGYLLRLGARIWNERNANTSKAPRLEEEYEDVCLRLSRVARSNTTTR